MVQVTSESVRSFVSVREILAQALHSGTKTTTPIDLSVWAGCVVLFHYFTAGGGTISVQTAAKTADGATPAGGAFSTEAGLSTVTIPTSGVATSRRFLILPAALTRPWMRLSLAITGTHGIAINAHLVGPKGPILTEDTYDAEFIAQTT